MRLRRVAYGLAGAVILVGTGILAATQASVLGPIDTIQPIAFPHDLHAGSQDQIPCEFCHYSVDRSVDAGIPPVQVCAGCHIAGGTLLFRRESPELAKLVQYWNEQRPIPWVRVYKLPDHAHFPHMRHIKAEVECQECHGQVETMREVELNQPLWMGWCIQCHRDNQVRTDCAVCHY